MARSLSKLGIKNGDIVALILPNLPETPIAFLACLEAGAIVTTANPYYTVGKRRDYIFLSRFIMNNFLWYKNVLFFISTKFNFAFKVSATHPLINISDNESLNCVK